MRNGRGVAINYKRSSFLFYWFSSILANVDVRPEPFYLNVDRSDCEASSLMLLLNFSQICPLGLRQVSIRLTSWDCCPYRDSPCGTVTAHVRLNNELCDNMWKRNVSEWRRDDQHVSESLLYLESFNWLVGAINHSGLSKLRAQMGGLSPGLRGTRWQATQVVLHQASGQPIQLYLKEHLTCTNVWKS